MLLKDKVAVVYGGSGAVGGAVARAFARDGAIVHLVARRLAPLEAIADDIRQAGGRVQVGQADALKPDDVAAHLEAVLAASGPVKIVFSAVDWGDSQGQNLTEMSYQRFILPVERGLKSWFNVGGLMARHMGENGGGVILGITANAAREAYTEMGGFGVACAAVEHFLRHLAAENGPNGVRCCWVRSPGSPDAPGVRDAWMIHARERGISFEEMHREAARDTPLRRIASLGQVADAAVLLASDLASSMTATLANTTGGAQVD
ncbi:SDR family oxidoreductase [Devosia sp. XJ19-1]|uniref:SDR family oxidoreductase n=1 Tax=Devosia ureilytica TaxID=2952754 RepID=A0A9Q4FRL2_9HYPH|nr:SDR family oxidoreductase [Devosia ureilytica]MCP8882159.1 SDR family oxidoreductase [Devosia ureilytica]MCP8885955.1 SDR family oxidoreductase [Devosia ureilytica]